MKILVITKGLRIALWAPLSLLKMKTIYKPLISKVESEEKPESLNINLLGEKPFNQTEEPNNIKSLPSSVHKILKDFKKEFGSFNLVDIDAADGTKVKIIL
jgi:hypothetical protein